MRSNRPHFPRARIDGDNPVGGAVLDVRIRLPRLAEQRGLGDDIGIRVEHQHLGPGLGVLQVPGHHRDALVGPGRAAIRDRRDGQDEHAAIRHGLDLAGELHGLRARLPRVEHRLRRRGQPVHQLPLKVHAGRDDEPVIGEIAAGHAHALGVGLDGKRGLVAHDHAALAQTVVAEAQALDGADAGEHEVAQGTGDELAIGLEQHHLDAGIADADILRGGGPAPAAADDHHPAPSGGGGLAARGGAAGQATGGRGAQQARAARREELPSCHRVHVPSPFPTGKARTRY